MCSDVLFQLCLDPIPQRGGVEGIAPPLQLQGGPRGVVAIVRAPPGEGSGAAPPKGIFCEKCLVKYCNFVFNLDRSLCHIYEGRSYVNLGFFSLEGNPLLYMRELYYSYVLF